MKKSLISVVAATMVLSLAGCASDIQRHQHDYLNQDKTLTPVYAPKYKQEMKSHYPLPKGANEVKLAETKSIPSIVPPGSNVAKYRAMFNHHPDKSS